MESLTGEELRERSFGELFKQLSEQTTTLVRQEVDLAKAEMAEKGKRAGTGAGLLGGGGLLGLGAFGALTATLILVLAIWLDAWLACLIVTVVYGGRRGRARDVRQAASAGGVAAGAAADHRDAEGGRGMGSDPALIRRQIAETRAAMGETIDAIAYKADLQARAKDKVTGAVDRAKESVSDAAASIRGVFPSSKGD